MWGFVGFCASCICQRSFSILRSSNAHRWKIRNGMHRVVHERMTRDLVSECQGLRVSEVLGLCR